jgi:drug/metabolite transporter (DMT)-like permease
MLKDYLLLHFIIAIWGFSAIVGKAISLPAMELVLHRSLMAGVVLWAMLYWQKQSFKVGQRALIRMLLTGALLGFHWILFFGSARVSNVSVCLAGMSTCTLWTSILEPLLTSKRIKWYEIVLGLLIIMGLYTIFLFEVSHFWGIIMAMGSALLASIFTISNAKLSKGHDPYMISFYEMVGALIACVLFLPVYQYFWAENQTLQLIPEMSDFWKLVFLAVGCTVYAYSVAIQLMKKISAFTMNLSVNMEPVYGIILAGIFYNEHEKLTKGFYLGTLIIIFSISVYPLLQRWDSRRIRKALAKEA